jgi:serine/threonine protein kinase
MVNKTKLKSFGLKKGDIVAQKYTIIEKLGGGWEGEVYKVRELHTKISRALKLYFPHRNIEFEKSKQFINKLHKLRNSRIVMNYHSHEIVEFEGEYVSCVICEYIEGDILGNIIKKQRGKRLGWFESLHVLYAIVKGVESIHLSGEYHGDLHIDNIMVQKFGLALDLKVIDLHHWGDSKKDNREEDIIKVIHIFYDILGGGKTYSKLPVSIKYIIKGLKRSLILKEFKTITHLRAHLENMEWDNEI